MKPTEHRPPADPRHGTSRIATAGGVAMTRTLWTDTRSTLRRPALTHDLDVDVCIIGAGITGVTAAALLAQEGVRVAVLEARALGQGTTGGTTAHATEILDTRFHQIEKDFGNDGARLVAGAGRVAIDTIESLCNRYAIEDAGFERVPGWLYADTEAQREELAKEIAAWERCGIAFSSESAVPLPFPTYGAARIEGQAQFHPLAFTLGLAEALTARGALFFDDSRVLAIDETDTCVLHLENGVTVRAPHVLLATHAPITRVQLQTKLDPLRSYVVAYEGATCPKGLYWDLHDPYNYIREATVGDKQYLLIGGADHRTGIETDTEARFAVVEEYAKSRFGVRGAPAYRWSREFAEPVDGIPFIGPTPKWDKVFVGTGYSGNGMTFGTVAAIMFADHVLNRTSPYAALFSPKRFKPIASAASFLDHNLEAAVHLFGDRISPPDVESAAQIARGEGKTMRVRGERLAVYRDEQDALHCVSAVCTHLGCLVHFNNAERSWDCPCHGSRFDVDGTVITGPAAKPLAKKSLETKEKDTHQDVVITSIKPIDA